MIGGPDDERRSHDRGSSDARDAGDSAMAEFLIEVYVPRSDSAGAERRAAAAEAAIDRLRAAGVAIRYVRSLVVPDDETVFLHVEAGSLHDVLEMARQAGLPHDRVVMAVSHAHVQETPAVQA